MAASAADAPAPGRKRRFRDLLPRVLSALVLAPLALAALWYGFPWIDLLAAIAAPLMAGEWLRLSRGRPAIRVFGLVYIGAALIALLWLRHQPVLGRETVLCIDIAGEGFRATGGGGLGMSARLCWGCVRVSGFFSKHCAGSLFGGSTR